MREEERLRERGSETASIVISLSPFLLGGLASLFLRVYLGVGVSERSLERVEIRDGRDKAELVRLLGCEWGSGAEARSAGGVWCARRSNCSSNKKSCRVSNVGVALSNEPQMNFGRGKSAEEERKAGRSSASASGQGWLAGGRWL